MLKAYQVREVLEFLKEQRHASVTQSSTRATTAAWIKARKTRVFYGSVVGIRDKITLEGESVSDLELNFRNAIDEYMAFCESEGEQPEVPFKGVFQVCVPTKLHKRAALRAHEERVNLNRVVKDALEGYLRGLISGVA